MERLLGRSHALGLRWALVTIVGVGIAAACSSDDASTPGDSPGPGHAGEGGDDSGSGAKPSSGGSGGSGAKPSGGTPTTMAGLGGDGEIVPAHAGEAGAGGADTAFVTPAGETCVACGDSECKAKLDACTGNTECAPWLSCVAACDTTECIDACDAKHGDLALVYTGIYECLCQSCQADCTVANACEKKTCTADTLPVTTVAPLTLADTGLYALEDDGAGGAGGASGAELAMPVAIAPYVRHFVPKYPLWADGAEKDRYVYIPGCQTINTTDMDTWQFPVGTRFWKTFTVGNKRVETRLMHRYGVGATDWLYAAYQWDDAAPKDPSKAKWTGGAVVPNANGTTHDIPGNGQCLACHNGRPEKVLGFGAIQLSHSAVGKDLDIERLSDLGWLSKPAPQGFNVLGTAVDQAALGYLHGNCGGCHFDGGNVPNGAPMNLRLKVAQTSLTTTDPYTTMVNVAVVSGNAAIVGKDRIEPQDAAKSAVLIRMNSRTAGVQMPPLGTEVVDTNGGVKDVTAWVNSIPK